MQYETQANALAQMMQKHSRFPAYELLLSFVTVRHLSMEKLSLGDVLLLRLERFECLLLNEGSIVACAVLKKENSSYIMRVLEVYEAPITVDEHKKYETLKLSFGLIQSKELSVGNALDISGIDISKVRLVCKEIEIAEASLVSVKNKIALRVDKLLLEHKIKKVKMKRNEK